VICYEHPLNERIRTLLRLEVLFNKVDFFSARDTSTEHHAALVALFEILDVTSRADLKSDLLQELERQRSLLEGLRKNPEISEEALNHVLNDIKVTFRDLLNIPGRIGGHLRDNEWLMGIKQRMSILGGACEFDLPSYHYWLSVAPEMRHHDFNEWITPLLPIRSGFNTILKLLRNSGRTFHYTAYQGLFQQTDSGLLAQMLRLKIDKEFPCVPEISANKYALNIRFIPFGSDQKINVYEEDIDFELTYCNL
jgi:cell division protein ZapD